MSMLSFLSSLLGRRLEVGDRVRLRGGYDMDPPWLQGKPERFGRCIAFIDVPNRSPAAAVELDEAMSLEGITGRFVVLRLRYEGARWGRGEVVHLELFDALPSSVSAKDEPQGKWIESHASYRVIRERGGPQSISRGP